MKIYPGPENDCVNIPYSICSTRDERWALAFLTKIFEIPGSNEQDSVEIVTNIVNPVSFLTRNTEEPVHHDCLETIEATYSSRPDLKNSPMENTENCFMDGSSSVLSGKRHARYTTTTSQEIIESGSLPINTSAQKAEIIALTCALELAQGRIVNNRTDSKYAFGVVHAHGAIRKGRG